MTSQHRTGRIKDIPGRLLTRREYFTVLIGPLIVAAIIAIAVTIYATDKKTASLELRLDQGDREREEFRKRLDSLPSNEEIKARFDAVSQQVGGVLDQVKEIRREFHEYIMTQRR